MSGQDLEASLTVWIEPKVSFGRTLCMCMTSHDFRTKECETGTKQIHKSHHELFLLLFLAAIVDKWNKNRELSLLYGCGHHYNKQLCACCNRKAGVVCQQEISIFFFFTIRSSRVMFFTSLQTLPPFVLNIW